MAGSFDDENIGDGGQKGQQRSPTNRRRSRLVLWAVVSTLLILALALGLGLGFGLKRSQGGQGSPAASSSSSPSSIPSAVPSGVWQPKVDATWQIVLDNALDIDDANPTVEPNVDVFDIDMFLHQNSTVVANLHKLHKKVVCYFSAGSYEPDRPDSYKFQSSDLGDDLTGWPGERWLNISSPAVQDIMASRIQIASEMGCDAIDPDNIDGYQNDNGLDLTSDDSIDFVTFLVRKARQYNLSIGLKNSPDIIPDVLSLVQFAVNEQCAQDSNCGTFHPFIKANKPVFHIEYPQGAPNNVTTTDSSDACSATGASHFSTLMKNMDLDGWVRYCDGATAETKVFS